MSEISIDLKNRLANFKSALTNYQLYQIEPINSQTIELRQLYHDLGHPPLGTCGSCKEYLDILYNTIIDLKI